MVDLPSSVVSCAVAAALSDGSVADVAGMLRSRYKRVAEVVGEAFAGRKASLCGDSAR